MVINYQVYLNRNLVTEDEQKIKDAVIEKLLEFPAIASAFDLKEVNTIALPANIKTMMVNGYNQKLSGDIQFIYKPQYFSGGSKGTENN